MPKLIFSLLLLVILSGCDLIFESKDPSNSKGLFFITNQITGDTTLIVAKADFPKGMTWEEANEACENLGNGWRLPDKDELAAMYKQLHKEGKGNFSSDYYWSSSPNYSGYAWDVNFDNGNVRTSNENDDDQVRAVRAF